jgi:hypothetical protein
MRRAAPTEYARPWLILCEGESDKRFLQGLIDVRGLPQEFQVEHPGIEGDSGGRSKFGAFLRGISTSESFIENVRAVLVVSDNDDVPADSFREVTT